MALQSLQQTHEELKKSTQQIALLVNRLSVAESENKLLRERVRLLQLRHWGKKSERFVDEGQEYTPVLPGLETPVIEAEDPDPEIITVAEHKRVKHKTGRRPLPASLPREERLVDLPESEKTCPTHGTALKKIGEERSESLEHIPETFKVIVTVRPKYLCPCCEEGGIKTAPASPRLIPGGIQTPSLLAHIVVSKFVDHLPLYRQETIYERAGVELARGTMAEWVIRLGDAVQPLINLLQEKLLSGEYLSCDETPIRVLTDNGKRVRNLHYLWIRSRPPDFGPPILLFEYASSRKSAVAKEILDEFQGFLQVDQYTGYDFTEKTRGIMRVGCFAHVRRKFFEALKITKTHGRKSSIPTQALALIKKLYQMADSSLEAPAEKRTETRKALCLPVLEQLKTLLVENQAKLSSQSATGKAISYTLNAWDSLVRIFDDYRIRLDNNLTENAIRPVAVGRKNYLFCQTPEGAMAAAHIYSLLATAKANGLDLRDYFIRLIDGLPKAKTLEDFEALLPLRG